MGKVGRQNMDEVKIDLHSTDCVRMDLYSTGLASGLSTVWEVEKVGILFVQLGLIAYFLLLLLPVIGSVLVSVTYKLSEIWEFL